MGLYAYSVRDARPGMHWNPRMNTVEELQG